MGVWEPDSTAIRSSKRALVTVPAHYADDTMHTNTIVCTVGYQVIRFEWLLLVTRSSKPAHAYLGV